MPKSFRLEPEQERALELAAAAQGVPVSVFIRDAVKQRCDEVLGQSLAHELSDVIGVVRSSGGRARRSGDAFKQLLKAKGTR